MLESANITNLNGITYFAQDSSQSDTDDEFGCGDILRPRHHDYEMFVMGFYYFFVLQDPFIMQFLDFQGMKCNKDLKNFKFSVMQDTITFRRDFMFQWVTTMVNLEVFESTAMFGKEYTNALQFNIQRLYYENLKQAKDLVSVKVSA